MEELVLAVPTTLAEMSLGQFIALMSNDHQKLFGIGDEEIDYIPAEVFEQASDLLDTVIFQPAEFANDFTVGDQHFIINWRLDEWTLEERLILDKLLLEKSVNDLHKLIALHTRPARKKISVGWKSVKSRGFWNSVKDFRLQKGKYIPKEWSRNEYEQRCELFYELMPADRAYSIAVFFAEFGNEMLKSYTDAILKNHPGI